jgi:hypothetical protein
MRLLEHAGELGIGVAIEVGEPHQGVVGRRRQPRRRPRHDRRRAAHDQRRHRADRERLTILRLHPAAWLKRGKRPVEPARVGRARLAEPAFQHVLAVEVRALAVGRRRRMHDRGLAGLVEPVQLRHRRIESEEFVEPQGRVRALRQQRLVSAQPHPVGIADRRHRGEAVERAAQHDGQESRVAAFRTCDPGQIGPGEQRARGEQQFAAGRRVQVDRHGVNSSGIPAPSATAPRPAAGSPRA